MLVLALQSFVAASQPAPPPQAGASAPLLIAASSWSDLNKSQQTALAPLARHWTQLSDGQRRKWLALAGTYQTLPPQEQEKMHSRMVEWAALSPRERETARLNFAQSKGMAKSDRAANWEAYQALSEEERKKLAAGAKVKPVGAAVPVKPVSPDKLIPVPVTRHTPESERAALAAQRPLNRVTLLPQAPVPAASAAALPSKP